MNVLIIGDRYQKGMKSKGCPALIKTKNYDNILEQQYSVLNDFFPNNNIIYIAGFEFKKVQNFLDESQYNIKLIHNDKYNEYNDTYALSLANNFLDPNMGTLIFFGYHLLSPKILDKFNKKRGSQIFVSKSDHSDIGCIIQKDIVTNISFDLPNKINNIYYICQKDMAKIKSFISNPSFKNYFLFETINYLIDNKIIFKYFFIPQNGVIYDH